MAVAYGSVRQKLFFALQIQARQHILALVAFLLQFRFAPQAVARFIDNHMTVLVNVAYLVLWVVQANRAFFDSAV